MSTVPSSGTVGFLRSLILLAIQLSGTQGAQIGGWLVGGNALALLAAFNAILAGTQCDPAMLMQAIPWFGAGLSFAFIGALVGFFVGQRVLHHTNKMLEHFSVMEMNEIKLAATDPRERLPRENNPLQAGINEALAKAKEISPRLTALRSRVWIAFVLYGASIVCFAMGAATPASSVAALRACAGAG